MSGKNAAKFWNFSCLHNIKANENLWHFLFSAAVVKSTSVNNKLIVSTVKGFVVLSALLVIGKFYLDELLCLACVCLQYNLHNPSTWLILFFLHLFHIYNIFLVHWLWMVVLYSHQPDCLCFGDLLWISWFLQVFPKLFSGLWVPSSLDNKLTYLPT